jgi:hypothetical protein
MHTLPPPTLLPFIPSSPSPLDPSSPASKHIRQIPANRPQVPNQKSIYPAQPVLHAAIMAPTQLNSCRSIRPSPSYLQEPHLIENRLIVPLCLAFPWRFLPTAAVSCFVLVVVWDRPERCTWPVVFVGRMRLYFRFSRMIRSTLLSGFLRSSSRQRLKICLSIYHTEITANP